MERRVPGKTHFSIEMVSAVLPLTPAEHETLTRAAEAVGRITFHL